MIFKNNDFYTTSQMLQLKSKLKKIQRLMLCLFVGILAFQGLLLVVDKLMLDEYSSILSLNQTHQVLPVKADSVENVQTDYDLFVKQLVSKKVSNHDLSSPISPIHKEIHDESVALATRMFQIKNKDVLNQDLKPSHGFFHKLTAKLSTGALRAESLQVSSNGLNGNVMQPNFTELHKVAIVNAHKNDTSVSDEFKKTLVEYNGIVDGFENLISHDVQNNQMNVLASAINKKHKSSFKM